MDPLLQYNEDGPRAPLVIALAVIFNILCYGFLGESGYFFLGMVDNIPPKKEEKSPLIMVAGAGDTREAQVPNSGLGARQSANGSPPIAAFTTIWNGSPLRRLPRIRNSWRDRWPEYLSACWMTFILVGISFLIFYIAGLVIYRQHSFVIFKYNNTTDTNMYYHKIVGDHVHFSYYSEFLSIQAMKYPNVRHYIYFMFDDTNPDRIRQTLFGKAVPNKGNVINTRDIKMFQRRFRNTNITVISLSKFFAKSPMKDIWMTIPSTYLSFYARLYSVWENGGIAIDLDTYNSHYEGNDKNLEYYIKDYQQKSKKIQHQEEEKSNAPSYYMGNGAIYVSYKLVRINGDEYANDESNSTEVEEKYKNFTNTIAMNETKTAMNETKTIIFTNKTANNKTFGEFHNASKEFITTKNNETIIEALLKSTTENILNKVVVNNTQELRKDGNESYVISNNTNDEIIETVQKQIELMIMAGDTKNSVSFEDLFSQPILQQLEISVSGPNYEGPFLSVQSDRAALPVLAIESSGTFIATAVPHHKLLEALLMSYRCRWLRPKYIIQNIMNGKCSSELYDHEICPHTFIY